MIYRGVLFCFVCLIFGVLVCCCSFFVVVVFLIYWFYFFSFSFDPSSKHFYCVSLS